MPGNSYLAPSTNGFPQTLAGTQTSAGAGTAGALIAAGPAGTLDPSFLPTGIGAPTQTVNATEALSAGDLVNIYNNAGTAGARKADASAANAGKAAYGFVLSAVANGGSALVYLLGAENTAVTGLTPGVQFLSGSTPGKCTATPPSTAGYLVQPVGVATSATVLAFEPQSGYTL